MYEVEKRALRAEMKERRAGLHGGGASAAIVQNFLQSPFLQEESFFVYLSLGSEAETRELIAALYARGKKICLPRIVKGEMTAVSVDGHTRFERGAYGLFQPSEGADTPCRVTVTPLLAYDSDGYRLGYGGGYYDRYFARRRDTLRVGIAFSGQAVKRLPREETDVPLQVVVTEAGVLRF